VCNEKADVELGNSVLYKCSSFSHAGKTSLHIFSLLQTLLEKLQSVSVFLVEGIFVIIIVVVALGAA
jgi:hypothetical protein